MELYLLARGLNTVEVPLEHIAEVGAHMEETLVLFVSMQVTYYENLNTLTSLPSSMLTILTLQSPLVKQMYFFWN